MKSAGRLLIKAAHADVVSHGVLQINQMLLANSHSQKTVGFRRVP
jgi:hypothetical protein